MPAQETQLVISADGRIRFIWSDDLVELLEAGAADVRRASHVEPTAAGEWTADLSPVGGPILGPFKLRGDALAAEAVWLEGRLTGLDL